MAKDKSLCFVDCNDMVHISCDGESIYVPNASILCLYDLYISKFVNG